MELPQLKAVSEKQLKYGNDMRTKAIEQIDVYLNTFLEQALNKASKAGVTVESVKENFAKLEVIKVNIITEKTEAKFWIDLVNEGFVCEKFYDEMKKNL